MKKLLTLLGLIPILIFGQTPTMRQVASAGTAITKLPSASTATIAATDTMMVFKGGVWVKAKIGVISPTLVAGTGISISTNTITNTAPNQTVTLTGAGTTTVSGTYPTYTVTGAASGLTVGTTAIANGTVGALLFEGAGNVLQEDATQLFWDNTNNRLGIGNAAPGYNLEVTGTARVSSSLGVNGFDANYSFGMIGKTTGLLTFYNSSFQEVFNWADNGLVNTNNTYWGFGASGEASTNTRLKLRNVSDLATTYVLQVVNAAATHTTLRMDGLGNLAVGTAIDPSARLHVKGSTSDASASGLLVENVTGRDIFQIQNDGIVKLIGDATFDQAKLGLYTNGANAANRSWAFQTNGGSNGNFILWQSTSLGGDPFAGTVRLNVTADGNFMLGDDLYNVDPFSSKLYVATASQTLASNLHTVNIVANDAFGIDKGGSIGLGGQYNGTANQPGYFAVISGRKANTTSGDFAGYLSFATRSALESAPTEALRIDSSQKVGIGISAPTARLHVKGSTSDALASALLLEAADGSDRLVVVNDGRLYGNALHNNAGSVTGATNQYIASGTYTATITDSANTSARTAYRSTWTRVGNVVHVAGVVDVDPTTTLTLTMIKISLPIPSNMTITGECRGTATAEGIAGQSAAIVETTAYAASDFAVMKWMATDVTNQPMSFEFQYEVK